MGGICIGFLNICIRQVGVLMSIITLLTQSSEREIAMSDNSLHWLKPSKDSMFNPLNEHVTCSGNFFVCVSVCVCLYVCFRAAVCDYACLIFGCCVRFKCRGLQEHLTSSNIFCRLLCRKTWRWRRQLECKLTDPSLIFHLCWQK